MKLLPSPDYFRDNVALRNDTLLGVCEALGHDLGLNPNFLRVPLAAGIIFAPLLMVGIYLALGAIVFVSRTYLPDRALSIEPVTQRAPESANEQADVRAAA